MASNTQVEFNCIKFIMEAQRPELLVSIVPEYFGNLELRKIFMLVRKFYVDNSTFMGWDLIRASVSKACRTPEKMKFLLSILDQIQGRDIAGLTEDILLTELRDYRKFRLVLDKVAPLISAVEDKDIDATLGKLKELHDSVFVEEEYQLTSCDLSEMTDEDIKFEFRSTGIAPLDSRGGLIKGGLTIIAAPAKTGKSTLAGMMATHQYLHEEGSVAVFSYEMSTSEVRARIFANVASMDVGTLMDGSLSSADRRKLWCAEADFYCQDFPADYVFNADLTRKEFFAEVFAAYPKRSNKFYIFDERVDWDELFIKMNMLVSTSNVKTIVCDYPFLIPRGKAHKELASWEYNLLMSKNLKTFSHKYGLNVITPAQLDQGKKGDDPKLRFVSNAINDCDLAIYLLNSEEDKTLGTVTWKWAAMRNFKTIPDQPYLTDFKLLKQLQFSRFEYLDY